MREKAWHKKSQKSIKLVMRVYRYQTRKKKKINTIFWAWFAGLVAVSLFLQIQRETVISVAKECRILCYEELLQLYLPGLAYAGEEGEGKNALEQVLAHFFLLEDAGIAVTPYDTQMESALSYEMILAREAADENYVDSETGEVVFTEGAPAEIAAADVPEETNAAADTVVQQETADQAVGQSVEGAGTGLPGTQEKQISYAREKLNDFDYLVQNFYQIDSTTTIDGSQLNADALYGKDLRLSHDASTPQILIYHTHSQEAYADSVPGDPADTVVGVGDYLTKLLTERYGMHVIHHTGMYDVDDRDHAYSKAGPALEQLLAENPSIEVVIDLHRDGVAEHTRLVTDIGGTQMAQVMFFNGLSRTTSTGDIDYLYNPYIADNLAMSFQMQIKAAEYYPGFTRRIYLKGYRYNMHYCPKTLLVEVGAQTNTVQEAMNAMVPLADVLNKVLTGAQ